MWMKPTTAAITATRSTAATVSLRMEVSPLIRTTSLRGSASSRACQLTRARLPFRASADDQLFPGAIDQHGPADLPGFGDPEHLQRPLDRPRARDFARMFNWAVRIFRSGCQSNAARAATCRQAAVTTTVKPRSGDLGIYSGRLVVCL